LRVLSEHKVTLLFISYVLASFLSVGSGAPGILKAFLALPGLVLFPLLFGAALLSWKAILRSDKAGQRLPTFGKLEGWLFSWFVGFLSIFVIMFLWLLHTQGVWEAVGVLLVVCFFGALRLDRENDWPSSVSKRNLALLSLLVVIGLIPIAIIAWGTFPLPSSRAYTVTGHLYPFVNNVATYGIPDTPYDVTHPPSLNILYGLVSRMFSLDPLALLWAVPFLLVPTLSVGMFLLAKEFSKRLDVAFAASILGVWLFAATNAADYPVAAEAPYVLYALCPYVYLLFHRLARNHEAKMWQVILSLAINLTFVLAIGFLVTLWPDQTAFSPFVIWYQIILLGCLVVSQTTSAIDSVLSIPFAAGFVFVSIEARYTGLAMLTCGTFYFILYKLELSRRTSPRTTKSVELVIVASLLACLFTQVLEAGGYGVGNGISSILGLGTYANVTLTVKWGFLLAGVGPVALVLLLLGGLYLLFERSSTNLAVLGTLGVLVMIYFLPIGATYRAMDLMAPLCVYVIAFASMRIVRSLRSDQVAAE
jgi:hypothetical protein